MAQPRPRKRRSPEQARREILLAAEQRLREHGLNGLNITDVAAQCGMSHATLLHHFGSTAGMRRALVEHMTDRLLRDMIDAVHREPAPEPPVLLENLFEALSRGGHARLLAWLSLGEEALTSDLAPPRHLEQLFARLVTELADRLPGASDRARRARRVVFLVACTAIGDGVAGERLHRLLAMEDADRAGFPDWLGRQIAQLMRDQPS